MRRSLVLIVIGAAIGVCVTLGAMIGRREYRLQQPALVEARLSEAGQESFEAINDVNNGLGPGFNAMSCRSCHDTPDTGGSGSTATLRAAMRDAQGLSHAYPGSAIVHRFAVRGCEPVVPAEANVLSRRLPTTTFGSGLVEAIPDADLIALEDPQDRNGDGVRGHAARVHDRASGAVRIGRFGWKSQQASLVAFTAEAYAGELGITSMLYPQEEVMGVSMDALGRCDVEDDPEVAPLDENSMSPLESLAAFMRTLPPPAPEAAMSSDAGEQLFASTGCVTCHRPQVGEARAYSDFLLHDIGTGDGIPQGDASAQEMRTALLWGIHDRPRYLHDGSADTIESAIARHGGEAARIRETFLDLPLDQRQQLISFVKSR